MRQVRSSALPAPAGRRKKISKNVPQIILNAVIILLLFLMIFPLAMSVWNAFKLDYQFEDTMWYPTFPLNIYNLFDAFAQLKEYILNTVVVGGISMVIFFPIFKIVFPEGEAKKEKTEDEKK